MQLTDVSPRNVKQAIPEDTRDQFGTGQLELRYPRVTLEL